MDIYVHPRSVLENARKTCTGLPSAVCVKSSGLISTRHNQIDLTLFWLYQF